MFATRTIDCTAMTTEQILEAATLARSEIIRRAWAAHGLLTCSPAQLRDNTTETVHPDAQMLYFDGRLIATFYQPVGVGVELRLPYEIIGGVT